MFLSYFLSILLPLQWICTSSVLPQISPHCQGAEEEQGGKKKKVTIGKTQLDSPEVTHGEGGGTRWVQAQIPASWQIFFNAQGLA